MHLTIITTCVNYADFLAHTLPRMAAEADAVRVISTPDDCVTAAVTKGKYGIDTSNVILAQVDEFHRGGALFNKGAAINAGMSDIKNLDWVLFTDADMLMPTGMHWMLCSLQRKGIIDKRYLHGCGRMICPNYMEYQWYIRSSVTGRFEREGWRSQHHRERGCWGSKGYFQLWHISQLEKQWPKIYPEEYDTAGYSDRGFYKQFEDEGKRVSRALRDYLWPVELHSDYWGWKTDDEFNEPGPNWKGRRTPYFC